MVLLAIAIRLDSEGPAIFEQERVGCNRRSFRMFKFRTMFLQDTTFCQTTRQDPRITRVGRFLRKTSLDELPQLFNVLRGDMSIVGPRPHALPHDHQFRGLIGEYDARHLTKPGMTGLAQIAGLRGATESVGFMERRLQADLKYLQHWSLALDFRILFATVLLAWTDERSY